MNTTKKINNEHKNDDVYFTVESSHGELKLDINGNVLWKTTPCCDTCITDIEWFDLLEWIYFHNQIPTKGAYFDILDLSGRMVDGHIFAASPAHRNRPAVKTDKLLKLVDELENISRLDIWYDATYFEDTEKQMEIDRALRAIQNAENFLRTHISMNLKTPWDFVEKYFPNYYGSDEIAYNNDLQKLIDEEYEEGDSASQLLTQLEKSYPSLQGSSATRSDTLQRLKNESDLSIYTKAIKGFISAVDNNL